jgi:hypothetical protein
MIKPAQRSKSNPLSAPIRGRLPSWAFRVMVLLLVLGFAYLYALLLTAAVGPSRSGGSGVPSNNEPAVLASAASSGRRRFSILLDRPFESPDLRSERSLSENLPILPALRQRESHGAALPRRSLPPPPLLPPPPPKPKHRDDAASRAAAAAAAYEAHYLRYTVRINSWKREKQLRLCLDHLLRCAAGDEGDPGTSRGNKHGESAGGGGGGGLIAEIQVVWCTAQGPPPAWLLDLQNENNNSTAWMKPRVTVELHEINSLNERFRILSEVSTAAVLSLDDDVLRPCVAMDAAFLKWTRQPHRMVGFDARTIVAASEGEAAHKRKRGGPRLQYGYLSTTERVNRYSLTLSRFAFVHQHYLRTYFDDMPPGIRATIDDRLNCEDIALSLWVSYQTNSSPPLLADYWALKTLVKLHSSSAISGTGDHKAVRDGCVTDFVQQLGLSTSRLSSPFVHYPAGSHHNLNWFDCGAPDDEQGTGGYPNATSAGSSSSSPAALRLGRVQRTVDRWRSAPPDRMKRELSDLVRAVAGSGPYGAGYIKNTDPWRKKFKRRQSDPPPLRDPEDEPHDLLEQ